MTTYPTFVDHVVLRVAKLDRAERFYTALLDQLPCRAEDSLMHQVGDTRLFFMLSHESQQEPYEKEKVGLNHIAFGFGLWQNSKQLKHVSTASGFPTTE